MKTTTLLGILLFSINGFSQDIRKANSLFAAGNYDEALEEYSDYLKTDSTNVEARYKLAVSYLNSNIDKSLAISHLEYVVKQKNAKANATYLLGRAYHLGYQFTKAISEYNKFKTLKGGSADNLEMVDQQIAYCENAIEIMKFPLSAKIDNLGKNVNSSYADYYPFIPLDESYVIFNSKRSQNSLELEDGKFLSNIYIARVEEGKTKKATLLSDDVCLNDRTEEVVGLTSDGSQAVLYIEELDGSGDLYLAKVDESRVFKPKKLSKNINSKYTELAGTLTNDGNSLYFASNKPGGYGGVDIYVCRKLPNGKWGEAQNLGPTINTEFDEDFPHLSVDGNKLYFSSKGHTSMGGYDIFSATWDATKRRFGSVQNMRYPINTPDDDMNFRMSESGRFGYISSLREGGYGDLDIYRITFNEVEPRYTVITGYINTDAGSFEAEDVYLSVFDMETDEIYGDYRINPNTMRYVIILPPGKFELNMEIDGFENYIENIKVLDKNGYKSKIEKNISIVKSK